MRTFIWKELDRAGRKAALARPENRRDPTVLARVRTIFDDIEARGFDGLSDWAVKLDGHAPDRLELNAATVDAARAQMSPEDLAAMELAAENVRAFQQAELPGDGPVISPKPGLSLQRLYRPITTAGLYIPGGLAPLFSTLIMTAVPAAVAGVPNRVCITPPAKDGSLHPMMIACAATSRLDAIWRVGGAHGIAAMALGILEGVPAADKLFGPGNKYVTEAKKYATERISGLAIDMPAGPSELLVIADGTANVKLVAADLLSQAEHDSDAQVILVALSADIAQRIAAEVAIQVERLPRATIAKASLDQARVFIVSGTSEAAEVSNLYGPEHLAIQIEDVDALVPLLTAAGTIFAGTYAAETFGDYAAGPSHVLPTDGAARSYDGITVRSFLTSFVVQKATREGAAAIAPAAARLARLEGLEAHALAADFRLEV
ncbi:histidinol dehydrogenase [Asticcacaulis biprosthecium C19]|uniref:Histidinol dehydrogenase n=1 Tax=Asticcacaulis biprosthecium C19 TaxID=715226 RepID=F4QL63_9CAUL|nr:histidinol dehydrogenase [Asticcacaulis biprosthecium]EGF93438.1 histidinol dehydrogenase [Asticcacaulis biprosthecium C19]